MMNVIKYICTLSPEEIRGFIQACQPKLTTDEIDAIAKDFEEQFDANNAARAYLKEWMNAPRWLKYRAGGMYY